MTDPPDTAPDSVPVPTPDTAARDHLLLALDLEAFRQAKFDADAILDAILDALVEVHDEIAGAEIVLSDPGRRRSVVTVHTSSQVCNWLYSLMKEPTA